MYLSGSIFLSPSLYASTFEFLKPENNENFFLYDSLIINNGAITKSIKL